MKKPQLFLIHFAGGNCYSFNFMTPLLHDFEVIPLELPGRGKRMKEGLLRDFDLAAKDICEQLVKKRTNNNYMIYGHSMGAYLSLRVTNLLSGTGPLPACLILSGNAGPGIFRNTQRYLLSHEEFIMELRRLGGVPEEVLRNEELLRFFDPILRADFEVAERNSLENEPSVDIPVLAVMGSEEEKVDQITNWKRFTKSYFAYEVLNGKHFFIYDNPRRIAEIIRDFYDKSIILRYTQNA